MMEYGDRRHETHPNASASLRPCSARGVSPVAERHVVGKFLDPESGVRIRFVSDRDPFPVDGEVSELLGVLRRRGVRAFFIAGGTRRLVDRFVTLGICQRIEVAAA